MASLTDLLHSEIDAQEELRDGVREKVDRLRGELAQIAQSVPPEQLFEVLAVKLGNELADDTTRAVRIGFEFAKRRLGNG